MLCPTHGRPCCLALCTSSRLLLAFENSFALFNPESHEVIDCDMIIEEGDECECECECECEYEWEQSRLRRDGFAVRLNDGRVNQKGELIIGGINETWGDFKDEWKAVQPCYCVSMAPNTQRRSSPTLSVSIIKSIPRAKITNSICFSLDGSTMYHTDTPTKEIRAFSSTNNGNVVIINTENQPDGSIVDAR